jgi:serine/threonine-protein kinase
MEYVEGDTLGKLLARAAQAGTRIPMRVGLRIVLDTLAGLDAAHELRDDEGCPLGIVHRDVSPQNVLVGVDGSARLSDFGVARATSTLATTRSGQLKGKLAYMAPEQARGHKEVDRRADLFAAGIVLWEVLTCRRLFKGDGEADTLQRVLSDPIPPVRSIAPSVPAPVEAVVAKALERDRSKRYATAAEFADALERASRVVAALGTHKDVAAHLASTLGTEMAAQREAVRAWLLRSAFELGEPTDDPPIESERAPESRSAAPVVAPAPSAVPSLTPPPSTTTIRPHARVTPWLAVVAAVVTGGALGLAYTGGPAPGTRPVASAPVVVASAAPSAAVVPAAAVAVASSDPSAPADQASAAVPAASPAVKTSAASAVATHVPWRPARSAPVHPVDPRLSSGPLSSSAGQATTPPLARVPMATTAAAAAPTSLPVPDDISRNPYR